MPAKFDSEIAKAKKIGADWISKSKSYKDVFISIKKDSLALEKGALTAIQKKAVAKTTDKNDLAELATIRERLKTFLAEGEKQYNAFDAWALKEPRKSMGFIATQLKLGKPDDEGYKAVSAATKTQLTDVATVIADVQRTWRTDLKVALENHLDKAKALDGILNKGKAQQKAFLDQLTAAIDRFKKESEASHVALKIDQFLTLISEINSKATEKQDKTKVVQRCQQAEQRVKVIPQLTAQIDKNYNRILKSVPPGFVDGFTATGLKKKLEESYAKSQKDMAVALKIATTAVAKAKGAKII